MQEYVCGFCLSPEKDRVVLIKKTKPAWQNGLLNGVGGKIESNELPIEAMVREFREETSVEILATEWFEFAEIEGTSLVDKWKVYFFATYCPNIDMVKTTTEEEVLILSISNLNSLPVINNLRWLIPMALDVNHWYCKAIAV